MKFAVALILCSLLIASPVLGSNCNARKLSRERVAEWHATLYNTINILGAPGGGASGLRAWAMLNLAMFGACCL